MSESMDAMVDPAAEGVSDQMERAEHPLKQAKEQGANLYGPVQIQMPFGPGGSFEPVFVSSTSGAWAASTTWCSP